jgi:hypothetical protein
MAREHQPSFHSSQVFTEQTMRALLWLHRLDALAVLFCVACPASGGAQIASGSGTGEAVASGSAIATRTVGFGEIDNRDNAGAPIGPRCRLQIVTNLRPLLEEMWRSSPAFRRQCARLEDTSLVVRVHIGLPPGSAGVGALSRTVSERGVVRRADVYPDARLVRTEEQLAHEIEHVLEQIDGVDVAALADQGVRGVRECRTADRQLHSREPRPRRMVGARRRSLARRRWNRRHLLLASAGDTGRHDD